jgi:hypothetical protein
MSTKPHRLDSISAAIAVMHIFLPCGTSIPIMWLSERLNSISVVSSKQLIDYHHSAQTVVLFVSFEMQDCADDASKEAGQGLSSV